MQRLFLTFLPTIFLLSSFASSQNVRGSLSDTNSIDEQHRNLGWLYDLLKELSSGTAAPTAAPTVAGVQPLTEKKKKGRNKKKNDGN
jgi:hypothetical protein